MNEVMFRRTLSAVACWSCQSLRVAGDVLAQQQKLLMVQSLAQANQELSLVRASFSDHLGWCLRDRETHGNDDHETGFGSPLNIVRISRDGLVD